MTSKDRKCFAHTVSKIPHITGPWEATSAICVPWCWFWHVGHSWDVEEGWSECSPRRQGSRGFSHGHTSRHDPFPGKLLHLWRVTLERLSNLIDDQIGTKCGGRKPELLVGRGRSFQKLRSTNEWIIMCLTTNGYFSLNPWLTSQHSSVIHIQWHTLTNFAVWINYITRMLFSTKRTSRLPIEGQTLTIWPWNDPWPSSWTFILDIS